MSVSSVSLSIIIVSFNTRELLVRCLSSIRQHPPAVPFEIMVVDNGSRDGSPEMVEAWFPEAQLIRNEENLGFGVANNRALRVAQGDHILFLNSDTVLLDNTLGPLLSRLATQPRVGIVGPVSQSESHTPYPSICPFPDLMFLLLTHTGLRARFHANRWINPYRGIWEQACRTGQPVAVDWLAGACMMVRRAVLDEIGLFDEGYFFYMEESDLCLRARRAGWVVELVPSSRVIHQGGGSSEKAPKGLLTLASAISELRFFQKHRNATELRLLKSQFLVEYLLKLAVTRPSDPRRWAYWEVIRVILGLRPAQITKEDRAGRAAARR